MLARKARLSRIGASLVSLCFSAGCHTTQRADEPILVFPPPPDKPRIQFLRWISGAEQVAAAKSEFARFILGEEGLDLRTINKPYGLAVHDGVAYVCDSKGLCINRLDFKNQAYSVFGVRGPGRLRKPVNIVVDALGFKFVADPARKQVVVFGPNDNYVTAFTLPDSGRPVDVALYENELFVLDNDDTPQVVVLDRRTGEVLRAFGALGKEPGQFRVPSSLCVSPEGYLYVSDTMNWRIQKLTREGEVVWVKGAPGYRPGQFGRPRGIRVGPNGVVYVVDGASEVVQMFNSDGQLLMYFGGPGDAPGALILPSSLAVDTSSIPYFQQYAHEAFTIEHLLFVASQYGERLVNVYAFGSFPEGYQLAESEITQLPEVDPMSGIGAVQSQTIPRTPNAAEEPKPSEEEGEGEED